MQDGKTGLQNKRVTGLAGRLQLHTPEHVYLFAMTEFRTCDEKGRENSRLLCRPTALIENVKYAQTAPRFLSAEAPCPQAWSPAQIIPEVHVVRTWALIYTNFCHTELGNERWC